MQYGMPHGMDGIGVRNMRNSWADSLDTGDYRTYTAYQISMGRR